MTADECDAYQEDFCIAKELYGKDFVCSGMVPEGDIGFFRCKNTNDDLVEACQCCEIRPSGGHDYVAYEEYCEPCAEEKFEEDKCH